MTEMTKKERREYHLALAGCLHEAQMHLGRYLEHGPTVAMEIGMESLRESIGEFIAYHEAVAAELEPKGQVIQMPVRTNSCPQRWVDDAQQAANEALRRGKAERDEG